MSDRWIYWGKKNKKDSGTNASIYLNRDEKRKFNLINPTIYSSFQIIS